MLPSGPSNSIPFYFGALLLLASTSFAALTIQQLRAAFWLQGLTAPGGCNRNTPNGKPMFDFVLEILGDGWELARDTLQVMIELSDERNRDLLFLFFGISTTETGRTITTDNSPEYFVYVHSVYNAIDATIGNPVVDPVYGLPRFRCLEDYAIAVVHLIGDDGRENMTANFAAVEYDMKMSDDQTYFPNLMYQGSPSVPKYYAPDERLPQGGKCRTFVNADQVRSSLNNAFTIPEGNGAEGLFGITACEALFTQTTFDDLAALDDDIFNIDGVGSAYDISVIEKYRDTAQITMFHQLVLLVTQGRVIDQPSLYPRDGNWKSRDWAQWSFSLPWNDKSIGYTAAAYLGLANPEAAQRNAANYVMFSLCAKFRELDCLGAYETAIKKREEVPFHVAPEVARKIRQH